MVLSFIDLAFWNTFPFRMLLWIYLTLNIHMFKYVICKMLPILFYDELV